MKVRLFARVNEFNNSGLTIEALMEGEEEWFQTQPHIFLGEVEVADPTVTSLQALEADYTRIKYQRIKDKEQRLEQTIDRERRLAEEYTNKLQQIFRGTD